MNNWRVNLVALIFVIALFLVAACEQRIKKVYDPSIPCPPETVYVKVPCNDKD